MGGGELWRLRGVDPTYFEVLYTKLIRHVSQGRILRGSARGALLVERDRYELGETIVIRRTAFRCSAQSANPRQRHRPTAPPDGSTEAVKRPRKSISPGCISGKQPCCKKEVTS